MARSLLWDGETLDVHIALDYLPYTGRDDELGWDPASIVDEIKEALYRRFGGAGAPDIQLVLVEVV